MTRSSIDLARPDSVCRTGPAQPSSRRNHAIAGMLLALTMSTASTGASAQFFDPMPGMFDEEPVRKIPARRIVDRLQNRGFTDFTRPRFDGEAYVVEATNPNGARIRLFVDAYDGSMLGRQHLGAAAPPRERLVRAEPGRGRFDEDGMIPPDEIPSSAGRNAQRDATLGGALRRGPGEAGPTGANPDAARGAKKNARLNPPQKPAGAEVSPAAPSPKIAPVEARKPTPSEADKQDAATDTSPKADPAKDAATKPADADAATKVGTGAPASESAASKASAPDTDSSEAKRPDAAAAATPAAGPAPVTPAWQEPPKEASGKEASDKAHPGKDDQSAREPEEPRKTVRVIEGATIVHGTETPAAN